MVQTRVPRRSLTRSSRAGFTLVELVVSMMILVVGMLALAGTAASVARLMGGGAMQTQAASMAQSRLERLRSVPCSMRVNGNETVRNVKTTWSVTPVTRAVQVKIVVTYETARGFRSRIYRSTMPC